MPAYRIPVSAPQNVWFDTQDVDNTDLTLEQEYNNQIETGIINNHFGSGILPDNLVPNILFNSNLTVGLLDSKVLQTQTQPSDPNNGNQLTVILSNSLAAGKRAVKIIIIGLDFQGNLQYETFTFHQNGSQTTSIHYTAILGILLNDFSGPPLQSFNLGGTIIIQEALPFLLSQDVVMIAQNSQPDLVLRDFFFPLGQTLTTVLTAALPNYNISSLNLSTSYTQLRSLVENDVSSQIGQKFLATTNNIQKITLLMTLGSGASPPATTWSGDLIVSIYPLQSTVSCISDIVPQLAIDYDPSNIPLAQLSINAASLAAAGTVLTLNGAPQPVDFVFSNTAVGAGTAIIPGNYYAFSIRRAGSASLGQIQVAVGTNSTTDMWDTLFNGSTWTDIPTESIWFEVYTDSLKVSSGQAYDVGHGMVIPKNQINQTTGTTEDYVLNDIYFTGNALYYALAQAITQDSVPVQNQRTGNNVLSQQQFVPSITLYNTAQLANIQNISEPLIIGTIADENIKNFSSGAGNQIDGYIHEYGFVNNQIVIKVITNPADGYRYDLSIINLVEQLVEGNLNGAQITPNIGLPNTFYRIASAELITMIYGDVNGDGIVDENDILAAQQLINENINIFPTYQQYIDNTTLFVNDILLDWQVINPVGDVVVASGTDGILTVNPINGTVANFNSASANFISIANLGNYVLSITNSISSGGNNGSFGIISLVDNNDITIQKTFFNSERILQIMRANISGSGIVSAEDIEYITNYVELIPPFPAPTAPGSLVGTTFQAIRLTLEEYVDRADDYSNLAVNRAITVHPLPDIYLDGYSLFASQNVEYSPLPFSITQELVWYPTSIVVNSNPRLVACAFNYQSGYQNDLCLSLPPPGTTPDGYLPDGYLVGGYGEVIQTFPETPAFDPGINNFFIPNNLVMNFGGQITNPDGYLYSIDFEQNTFIIEIPADGYFPETTVNIFTDLVADYSGTGTTRIGYSAMRYADCSFVGMEDLINNKVRFEVSVQSFSPLLGGIDPMCLTGVIVDDKIGVNIDYTTGLLTLSFSNLYQSPILQTANTKIQITVLLKKAGWNNQPVYMNSTRASNWLGLPIPTGSVISCPTGIMITP
jgi:hypothetical protein